MTSSRHRTSLDRLDEVAVVRRQEDRSIAGSGRGDMPAAELKERAQLGSTQVLASGCGLTLRDCRLWRKSDDRARVGLLFNVSGRWASERDVVLPAGRTTFQDFDIEPGVVRRDYLSNRRIGQCDIHPWTLFVDVDHMDTHGHATGWPIFLRSLAANRSLFG
jgi:hypothetical protein